MGTTWVQGHHKQRFLGRGRRMQSRQRALQLGALPHRGRNCGFPSAGYASGEEQPGQSQPGESSGAPERSTMEGRSCASSPARQPPSPPPPYAQLPPLLPRQRRRPALPLGSSAPPPRQPLPVPLAAAAAAAAAPGAAGSAAACHCCSGRGYTPAVQWQSPQPLPSPPALRPRSPQSRHRRPGCKAPRC